MIAAGIGVPDHSAIRVDQGSRLACVDTTGDPWDGRTLEWITTSPPPSLQLRGALPNVQDEEAYWSIKTEARDRRSELSKRPDYDHFEMPHNSPTGVVTAFFCTVMGFALIWHIWWLVALGFLGAWATFVIFSWRDEPEYEVSAAEAKRRDDERRRGKAPIVGVGEDEALA